MIMNSCFINLTLGNFRVIHCKLVWYFKTPHPAYQLASYKFLMLRLTRKVPNEYCPQIEHISDSSGGVPPSAASASYSAASAFGPHEPLDGSGESGIADVGAKVDAMIWQTLSG
jgi:hypothetical protein